MKRYILACLVAASAFTACKREDFLDRYPQSALSEPTFFKNENDLKLYANRFYPTLPIVTNGTGDDQSDNVVTRTPNTFLAGTYVVPTNATTASGWTWTTIREVNYFLQRYNRASEPDAVKNRYAAEARFFRALYYWQKVKQFGDVPLYTTDLTDTSAVQLNMPRTSRKVVMAQVLEDLNFAVDNLPLPSAIAAADRGRLHKFAALTLKARICLWEGTFRRYHSLGDDTQFIREAATAAETVINTGGYNLFTTGGTGAAYYNLFIQDDLNVNNPENILSRTYIKDLLMQNTSRSVGQSNNGFSKNFASQYLCTDGKPISQSALYQGDNTPDDEAANRDPRYKQTIATRGFVFLVNPNGTQDLITLPRIGSAVTSTGYQMVKYRSSDNGQNQQAQSTIDISVFRYAEVLLAYAEAKAELGEATQDVIDRTINRLRARAGMPNMVIGSLVKDANSDFPVLPVLIDEIRRERRIELVLEGFRFDDLLRWKAGPQLQKPETILGMKLTPAVRAQYPASQVANVQVNANNYITIYPSNRVWNDRQYYFPIPTQEILLNPRLVQNPGW